MQKVLEMRSKRIIEDLKELAQLTSDHNGAQRVAWTPIWRKSREWFKEKAEALGAQVTQDTAGNVWTKLEGKSKKGIIIGSHLDSVPNGGWLDGALGVLSGLEVIRYFVENNEIPEKTLYVVDWADEEGARYGYSCLGSSAASGTLNIAEFKNRVDSSGTLFEEAIAQYGVSLDGLSLASKAFKEKLEDLEAYLEFHIEQGPVLEQNGKVAASVYGAAGVERHYIDFIGQSAHAGSFPIKMRQDAFLAAAQSALAFRELALKYSAVCTVGSISVTPDVVTIVPGSCTISLDMRTIDKKDLQKMLEEAKDITNQAAETFGCRVSWRKIYSVAPQLFDDNLVELGKKAVEETTGEPTCMYSGPLHDAVEMAKHLPTVMVFVMSKDGISHAKEEDTPENELNLGIQAYLRLIDKVLQQ